MQNMTLEGKYYTKFLNKGTAPRSSETTLTTNVSGVSTTIQFPQHLRMKLNTF